MGIFNKRLANPKFITQEKKIYPHWWWNLKDDIEQDDYSEDDSDVDHVPNRLGRFPKNIEERLKKKAKRHLRNKSFSGIRPVQDRYYDEAKIFPNSNLNTNNDLDNSPYRKRDNSPFDEESGRPFGGTGYDGFGRPIPKVDNSNPIPNNIRTDINPNDNTLTTSPLYQTSPNLRFTRANQPENDTMPGQGSPFGPNNRSGVVNTGFSPNNGIDNFGNPRGPINGSQSPYGPNGQGINPNNTLGSTGSVLGMSNSLYSTNPLKNQILNKRTLKQSTFLSYDKDFNLNGAFKKVKGQEKKGLKYSLSGNQLKEDRKGIRRRKK